MRERFGGLRLRLALAISAVSLVVVVGAFVALRASSDADLRDRIDRELAEQYAEFRDSALTPTPTTRRRFAERSRRFVDTQRYHPKSRIFVIQVAGDGIVTNEPTLLRSPTEGEAGEELGESGLLRAPPGLTTLRVDDAGSLRVLSEPVRSGGRRLGTFRVADPLRSIEEARSGLDDAFLLVGLGALVASLLAAAAIATLLTRPLRRMAAVALAVDAGELGHRIGPIRPRDEIGALAESFDHMLDRLEAAFGRQEDFVSDASHELRTPLTVLRGQIELLERETDPAVRRRSVETVLRELDHMSRLVDDMLTLAAAEGGDLVHTRAVDLGDFLEDLRRDLPLLGARRYELVGVSEGVLEADPERLTQVFRNLVRNAVAATGPDGRIQINASRRDGSLEFTVSDDGPGIPPDELERVFDRLHRAGGDSAKNGTGLGLPIARAIVEAHGGTIVAESPAGAGTTIRFDLPHYRRA